MDWDIDVVVCIYYTYYISTRSTIAWSIVVFGSIPANSPHLPFVMNAKGTRSWRCIQGVVEPCNEMSKALHCKRLASNLSILATLTDRSGFFSLAYTPASQLCLHLLSPKKIKIKNSALFASCSGCLVLARIVPQRFLARLCRQN